MLMFSLAGIPPLAGFWAKWYAFLPAVKAGLWSLVWVAVSFVFVGWLWWYLDGSQGRDVANTVSMQFITGYLVEKSLSIDNIFVFLMIFSYFAVPAEYQKRALIVGIIAAIVLRAILILVGAWLLASFHWILYVFGAFLVITGVKMWLAAGKEPEVDQNPVLRFLRKRMNLSTQFDGEKLVTWINGVKYYTPMFVVLVMIGTTDVIFAVDSIPAIFAITSDPFASPYGSPEFEYGAPAAMISWVALAATATASPKPKTSTLSFG